MELIKKTGHRESLISAQKRHQFSEAVFNPDGAQVAFYEQNSLVVVMKDI